MVINDISQLSTPADGHSPRVIISGGGTGGHIYPALAIAAAVKKQAPGAAILFVGALGRMEMEKVPAAGYDIVGLPVRGFDRKRLWRNAAVMLDLWKSMRRCRRLIVRFRPDIVIGVGGYASAAVMKVAQNAGIPTLVQEQNSYAGVTNKLLAKRASKICVAYDGMESFFPARSIVMTGNPIREAIADVDLTPAEARRELGFPADRPLLLVTGGSLGARTINESMAAALDTVAATGASVLWQTGKNWTAPAPDPAAYPAVKQVKFIDRMDLAYRAADLVVARAGACTISELQLLGKPAILVPSPNVAEDHQRKNAEALARRDAAVMILDSDCRDCLADRVTAMLADPALRERTGRNAAAMALRGSAERIAAEALALIDNNETSTATTGDHTA